MGRGKVCWCSRVQLGSMCNKGTPWFHPVCGRAPLHPLSSWCLPSCSGMASERLAWIMKAVRRITSAQLGRICSGQWGRRGRGRTHWFSACLLVLLAAHVRPEGWPSSPATNQPIEPAAEQPSHAPSPAQPSPAQPGRGAHMWVLVPALGDEAAQRLGAVWVQPRPLAVDGHL